MSGSPTGGAAGTQKGWTLMEKIKPFTTEHTWRDPDNAMDFYEEKVGAEFPDEVVDFLYHVAEVYPDALYNVQPGYSTNYVAVARKGDRRSWMFVKPDKVSVWVAHSRNADALRGAFPELREPETLTKHTRQFVDIDGASADSEGLMVAVEFAACHARPLEEELEKFS